MGFAVEGIFLTGALTRNVTEFLADLVCPFLTEKFDVGFPRSVATIFGHSLHDFFRHDPAGFFGMRLTEHAISGP